VRKNNPQENYSVLAFTLERHDRIIIQQFDAIIVLEHDIGQIFPHNWWSESLLLKAS
jgi:hypothetical protein